jgi:putative ABC transport system ATP-binding protein
VQALKGVDFDARCGEMIMLVGPSGCGKTTFLSVVCGTMKADEGSVRVFDTDIMSLGAGQLTDFRGKNVGFIFQQFNLIPTWTIVENASVPLLLNGASRRKAEDAAAIARALVHQPKLLICDEPTASLDAATGRKVMELLKDVACGPDRCVIVVTHDSRIFSFADRIAEMEDGVVKAVHDAGEYKAQYV